MDGAVLEAKFEPVSCADRFPLSPRIRGLKRILDKLEPPSPASETLPPPKPPGERSTVLSKKRRR